MWTQEPLAGQSYLGHSRGPTGLIGRYRLELQELRQQTKTERAQGAVRLFQGLSESPMKVLLRVLL